MSLNKDPESWRRVSVDAVMAGSKAQGENVLRMAIEDILWMQRVIDGEQDARRKCESDLRQKDAALGVLFSRLAIAGVDCSDLIS